MGRLVTARDSRAPSLALAGVLLFVPNLHFAGVLEEDSEVVEELVCDSSFSFDTRDAFELNVVLGFQTLHLDQAQIFINAVRLKSCRVNLFVSLTRFSFHARNLCFVVNMVL